MSSISELIESKYFFPIVIVEVILIVLLVIYLFMSRKKKNNQNNVLESTTQNIEKNEVVTNQAEPCGVVAEQVETQVEPTVKVENPINFDENEEVMEDKTVKKENDNVIETPKTEVENLSSTKDENIISIKELVVDIPVPNVDNNSYTVEKKTDFNDVGETVNLELTHPSDESNIQNENVDIGLTTMLSKDEDAGEEVTIPKIKQKSEEGTPAYKINAFDFKPSDNHDINENIVPEKKNEYVGEKTEIFDFPDFDSENSTSTDSNQKEV